MAIDSLISASVTPNFISETEIEQLAGLSLDGLLKDQEVDSGQTDETDPDSTSIESSTAGEAGNSNE